MFTNRQMFIHCVDKSIANRNEHQPLVSGKTVEFTDETIVVCHIDQNPAASSDDQSIAKGSRYLGGIKIFQQLKKSKIPELGGEPSSLLHCFFQFNLPPEIPFDHDPVFIDQPHASVGAQAKGKIVVYGNKVRIGLVNGTQFRQSIGIK